MEDNRKIMVSVHRRLDNRPDLPDDSPLAWELHWRRSQALHDAFDKDPVLQVVNWGETDDKQRTHEEIWLQIIGHLDPQTVHTAFAVGAGWLGGKLLDKGFDAVWVAGVKAVMQKLRKPQEDKKVQELRMITGEKDGLMITIRPPDQGGNIQVVFRPYEVFEYDYVADKPIVRDSEGRVVNSADLE